MVTNSFMIIYAECQQTHVIFQVLLIGVNLPPFLLEISSNNVRNYRHVFNVQSSWLGFCGCSGHGGRTVRVGPVLPVRLEFRHHRERVSRAAAAHRAQAHGNARLYLPQTRKINIISSHSWYTGLVLVWTCRKFEVLFSNMAQLHVIMCLTGIPTRAV